MAPDAYLMQPTTPGNRCGATTQNTSFKQQATSSQVVGPARKFFIQLASAMIQGTSRKQAQASGASKHRPQAQASKCWGGTRPQVFSWLPATLCHMDKMFLNLGPTFSNSCARNTLMQLDDLRSFIKFYGTRTE